MVKITTKIKQTTVGYIQSRGYHPLKQARFVGHKPTDRQPDDGTYGLWYIEDVECIKDTLWLMVSPILYCVVSINLPNSNVNTITFKILDSLNTYLPSLHGATT